MLSGIAALGTFSAAFGNGLGTADHQLAAHVFLVVKLVDGALGLIDGGELDETEPLGTMGLAVADDLDVLDGTDAPEEIEQIALGRIEGEVADIDAGSGHLDAFRLARLARRRTLAALGTFGAGCALGLAGSFGLLVTQTDDGQQLSKEALFLRGLLFAALGTLAARTALGAAGGAWGTAATTTSIAGASAVRGII
jgi:hypothetical protein